MRIQLLIIFVCFSLLSLTSSSFASSVRQFVPYGTLKKTVYHVDITTPDGLTLKNTKDKGLGLFATKEFKKGEVIYEAFEIAIPRGQNNEYVYHVNNKEIKLKIGQHFGTPDHNLRLYGFDVFINHSCQANSYSEYAGDPKKEVVSYKQIALRDIKVGEELSCNYFNYVWEREEKGVKCQCNTKECFGYLKGFSDLSAKDQESLIHYAHPLIKERYYNQKKAFLDKK